MIYSFENCFHRLSSLREARISSIYTNDKPSDTSLFKFFSSAADLLSALRTGRIWPNENVDNKQADPFCARLKNATGRD